jgi:hypothetical protein
MSSHGNVVLSGFNLIIIIMLKLPSQTQQNVYFDTPNCILYIPSRRINTSGRDRELKTNTPAAENLIEPWRIVQSLGSN